jgi:hypothetical protein
MVSTASFRPEASKVAIIAPVAVASGAASIIFNTCCSTAADVAGVNIPRIIFSRACRPPGPLIAAGFGAPRPLPFTWPSAIDGLSPSTGTSANNVLRIQPGIFPDHRRSHAMTDQHCLIDFGLRPHGFHRASE